jgi:broad specificity phosphatase PhoE
VDEVLIADFCQGTAKLVSGSAAKQAPILAVSHTGSILIIQNTLSGKSGIAHSIGCSNRTRNQIEISSARLSRKSALIAQEHTQPFQ